MSLIGGDPVERISVELVAKTGKFFNKVDGAVNKATGRLGGFAKNMGKLLVAGAAVGGVALAAVGAAAVKMGIDFEKSIAEVKTLLPSLSEQGFNVLKSDLLDLSKEMGVTTDELVPALYQAISAGVPPENVIDFLRVGAKASIGGVTDLTTAIDGLTTITNAWGLESDQAGRVADVMFTGVKLGKTTMAELSASMFQAAPLAAALGVSVEEVVAATATLTKSGVPTSVAMTQMRQAMVALTKPTADMTTLLEKTGFASGEALIEAKGFTGALNALTEAADNDKEVMGKAFGSVEALGFVLGVTGDNAQTAADDLAAVMDSTGAADEAFQTMNKTVSRKLAKAFNLLRVALTQIGLKALPFVASAIDALISVMAPAVELLEGMLAGGDDLKKSLKGLPSPVQRLVRAFRDIVRVGMAFVNFLRFALVEGDLLNDFLVELPLPLAKIAVNIAKLVGSLGDFGRASGTVLAGVGELVLLLATFFLELALAVGSEVFADFVDIMTFLLDNVLTPMVRIVGDVSGKMADLTDSLTSNKDAMETVKNILVALVEAWLLLLAAKKVVTLVQNIARTGKAFLNFLTLPIRLTQKLTQTVLRTGRAFINMAQLAKFFTQRLTQKIARTGAKFIDTAKLAATTTQNITQKITKVETPKSVARGAGIKFAQGFAGGLGFGLGAAAASAAIAAGLIALILGLPLLAIGAVLAAVIVAGLVIAFPSQAGAIAGTITGTMLKALIIMAGNVVPFIATLPVTLFGPLLSGVIDFFENTFGPDVATFFQAVIELRLGDAAEAGLELILDLFVRLPQAIIDGMAEGFTDLKDSFLKLLDDIAVDLGVDLDGLVGDVETFAADALAAIINWGIQFAQGFTDAFFEASGITKEEMAGIVSDIKTGFNDVVAFIGQLPATVGKLAGDFFDAAKSLGAAIIDGLIDGIGSVPGIAGDVATAVYNAIASLINSQLISKINRALEFKIDIPLAPDINVNPPDIPFLPRLRHGGRLAAGELAIVNEGDIEFFRPFSSGMVMPIAPDGGGGGGNRMTNYGRIINVFGPRQGTREILRNIDRMVS